MSRAALDSVLYYARSLAGGAVDQPEPLLLERFLARREGAAFAALVERHGPMVLGVCRRVLGNAADADDAFQATFLVLARQAAALRQRASLASWLYGIACRVAWRARADAARRRLHERQAQALRPAAAELPARELGDVLAEELARLPEKYRLPVVLCHLEGRTNEEAARQLGWPVGSVKGRLARARELLRARLTRRGFGPSAALLGTALAAQAADALPPGLAQATLRAALATGLGLDAERVSASVTALAEGALRPAAWARLKLALAVLLVLAAGSAGALLQGGTDPRPPHDQAGPTNAQPPGAAVRADRFGDPLPPGVSARLGTVRFRQLGQILALTYSADGKWLASAGWDPVVRLWDASTGRPVRTFPGHDRWAWALAISPDGKLLASGGYDGTLRLSELLTGKEVRFFKGHRFAVSFVSFSPDGKLLASGGGDGRLVLWDVATGQVVHELMKSPDPRKAPNAVGSVSFAPDGKSLAACARDGDIRVFEVATGQERHRLRHPGGGTPTAAFSRDGRLLASGGSQGSVALWEAGPGKLRRTWPAGMGNVNALAFSPDGQMLAVVSWVSSLLIQQPHGIRLLNVDTGREVRRLEDDSGSFYAVAFAPDGRTLAVSDTSAVRRWDTATGRELTPHGGHRGAVLTLAVSADGRAVYSGGEDAAVRPWDATTGKEVRAFAGHRSHVLTVRRTADGKLLATAGHDGAVYLWDPDGVRPRRELPGVQGRLRGLALAPDGRTVATAADDLGLRLWDVAAGKEPRRLDPAYLVYCLAFAPDGKTLVTGGQDRAGYQRLQVWDVATGREVGSDKGLDAFTGVAFSPEGRWVAAALHRKDPVRLYDARGKEVRRLHGHRGSAFDVAFAPGGWMLASAGEDGTVRLWEAATGQERRRLDGHTGPVHCVAFSADGRTLVSGGADTTVLVWNLDGAAREPAKGRPTPVELDGLWADLAGEDAARAYDAICRLSASPGQAVPLLRERLLGGKVAVGPVGQWIRELDDPQFVVREKASRELAKLGRQVEPELRRALAGASPEARLRLERLLMALPGAGDKAHDPERLRALRALEVLEQTGTPEARRAVEALARARAGTLLGSAAREVLARLKKQAVP
jgi:RNA polymerase sigma factor (sigma-70 family)